VADIRRLPRPVTQVWDWQIRGACRDVDSTLFFHPDGTRGPTRTIRETRAQAICATCPVIAACRHHALSVQEPYGVWGGLTEADRAELLHSHGRGIRLLHRSPSTPA
jgi:WhiB family transcriptional regulator, redox-sensing transcriptional regulator